MQGMAHLRKIVARHCSGNVSCDKLTILRGPVDGRSGCRLDMCVSKEGPSRRIECKLHIGAYWNHSAEADMIRHSHPVQELEDQICCPEAAMVVE